LGPWPKRGENHDFRGFLKKKFFFRKWDFFPISFIEKKMQEKASEKGRVTMYEKWGFRGPVGGVRGGLLINVFFGQRISRPVGGFVVFGPFSHRFNRNFNGDLRKNPKTTIFIKIYKFIKIIKSFFLFYKNFLWIKIFYFFIEKFLWHFINFIFFIKCGRPLYLFFLKIKNA